MAPHGPFIPTNVLTALLLVLAGTVHAQRQPLPADEPTISQSRSRADSTLIVYPSPHGIRPSDVYEVTALYRAKPETVFVYKVTPPIETPGFAKRDGAEEYRKQGVSYNFATFSYQGMVTVRVKKRVGTFQRTVIRPTRLSISAKTIDNQTIEFELRRQDNEPGQKLSVEFDGQTRDRLFIFADPLERTENLPDRSASNAYIVKSEQKFAPPKVGTIVFEPGVHSVGVWQVPQEVKHVYIAGGAYVYGALDFGNRGDVLVNGRGVLSGEKFPYLACKTDPAKTCPEKPWQEAVHLISYGGDGFRLEGITTTRPAHYTYLGQGAKNVRLENFKIVGSFRYEEDGLQVNTGATVKDCFVNAMDDSFKMYFERGRINNCVVWQGANGAVFQYGWYNKSSQGNVVTNIDIIHADWTWGKGATSSDTATNNNAVFGYVPGKGANGEIRNETYRAIVIETPVLRIFGFHVPAGQAVSNFDIENISVPEFNRDAKWKTNYFWANGGTIEGLKITRFTVGGKLVTKENAATTGALELLGTTATFNQ